MAVKSKSKSQRKAQPHALHKPRGVIHPRVQAVGPEHFAFLCVDCAKARSKMMLADFYGRVVLEPTTVEHNKAGFDNASKAVRDAMAQHHIKDVIVVVERTGRYHGPIQRAFRETGFEVRVVHPFTTKQYRLPADPGNKTDDTDLSAIHRAAVNGFGLSEHEPDPVSVQLQLLARHRRKLVRKRVVLQQQMLEHLQSFMPGYSKCFADVFDSPIVLWGATNLGSAAAILEAGVDGLTEQVRRAGIRGHQPTVEKIVAWARSAPSAEEPASLHQRIFVELEADRLAKAQSIEAVERDLAGWLARTPYMLLLSIVGINVVSAAEFAGEMGPIERYTKARAITGRAGLFPSRYQSDEVDRRNGTLVRHANHSLRYAILMIADNLIRCNEHFRVLAAGWRLQGKDAHALRIQAAGRFCRIAYYMVAGRNTFQHPSAQRRDYILDKLIRFSLEHSTEPDQILRNLDATVAQLPRHAHREEAVPLAEELARVRKPRGAGPKVLRTILPAVLAKLEVELVRSNESGEPDPTE
ncbi:MAG TPA: transposase [Isosphaeraceae bacterium]|jgi:transposase|nr:transposase [Isosphaeraceae bacterium]